MTSFSAAPKHGAGVSLQHAEQQSAKYGAAETAETADYRCDQRLDDKMPEFGIDAGHGREQQSGSAPIAADNAQAEPNTLPTLMPISRAAT